MPNSHNSDNLMVSDWPRTMRTIFAISRNYVVLTPDRQNVL